ncbi:MAG: hypothetical protein CTY36_01715 [Methylocystis sp.]|nr:MAG: hypothetical protein CTY36_01715 [Methylocystis sp.]
MPIAAILAKAKVVATKMFEFAETWLGGVIIAFAVAWLWSGWRHDAACSAREAAARAAAEAAVQAQVNEWKTAAEDVARDATARVEEDARAAQAQSRFIANMTPGKDSPHVPNAKDDLATDFSDRPLFLDPDYIAVVRAFDAAADRLSDPTRSAKELRQAGALAKSDRCAALKVWGLRNRAVASEANRRLVSDGRFYNDVLRKFSAGSRRRVAPSSHEE